MHLKLSTEWRGVFSLSFRPLPGTSPQYVLDKLDGVQSHPDLGAKEDIAAPGWRLLYSEVSLSLCGLYWNKTYFQIYTHNYFPIFLILYNICS
jgi:hypothetical protein